MQVFIITSKHLFQRLTTRPSHVAVRRPVTPLRSRPARLSQASFGSLLSRKTIPGGSTKVILGGRPATDRRQPRAGGLRRTDRCRADTGGRCYPAAGHSRGLRRQPTERLTRSRVGSSTSGRVVVLFKAARVACHLAHCGAQSVSSTNQQQASVSSPCT